MKLLRACIPIFTAVALWSSPAQAATIAFSIAGPSANDVDTAATNVALLAGISGTIVDLNVSVHITGGHMEDFDLYLTSPDGTTVQFRSDFLVPFVHINSPLNATFDDEALSPHSAQTAGAVGTFQPFSPLSAFDGENLSGTWTLAIQDTFAPAEGDDLISWSISGLVEQQVPEPSTLLLFGTAAAFAASRRRQRT
jgi:subtilisin-like proprotein convertase family protein